MKGMGPLQTPGDLLEKMKHDLERLRARPNDGYAAFDFFVAAYHMLDWVSPVPSRKADIKAYGKAKARHKAITDRESLLLIAGHLADSGKHFEATMHDEVSATFATAGYFPPGYFPPSYFPKGYFAESELVIRMTDAGAKLLGGTKEINALAAAERLYAFWASELAP